MLSEPCMQACGRPGGWQDVPMQCSRMWGGTLGIIVGCDGVPKLHLHVHSVHSEPLPTATTFRPHLSNLSEARTTASYCDWSMPLSSNRCVRSSLRKSMRSW